MVRFQTVTDGGQSLLGNGAGIYEGIGRGSQAHVLSPRSL